MSDRIRLTKVGMRPEVLGGADFYDDLDEVPHYFVRFETERDLKRWWGCHDTRHGASQPAFRTGWYAAFQSLEYVMGSCAGLVWSLELPGEAPRTYRELREQLEAIELELAEIELVELGAAAPGSARA